MQKVSITLDLDFALLRKQKKELLNFAFAEGGTNRLLEGIVSVIDEIQDQSVEANGVSEMVVFGHKVGLK